MNFYSALKENDIMNFAGNLVELDKTIQTEVTNTQNKNIIYLLISGYVPLIK